MVRASNMHWFRVTTTLRSRGREIATSPFRSTCFREGWFRNISL